MVKEASFYEKNENHIVKCASCARECAIEEGKSGVCGTKRNINGKLMLLNYGRFVSIHVDPIEKKPLYHYYPGSKILSLGSLGCNFKCSFCQNWDISQFPTLYAKQYGRDQAYSKVESLGESFNSESIAKYCNDNAINHVAFTYNEPTISLEFIIDCKKQFNEKNLRVVLVSNGYISDKAFNAVSNEIDGINIDLKGFSEDFYRKHCKAELSVVKKNIEKFCENGVWTEVTMMVIPGENDGVKEVGRAAKFLKEISPNIPLHLTRFFPEYRMQDKEITPVQKLLDLQNIAYENGLKYVYIGNTQGLDNTSCPNCNSTLIERTGYETQIRNLEIKNGLAECRNCKSRIDGRW